MEFADQNLLAQYQRWVDETAEKNSQFHDCVISLTDVLNAHFSVVDYFLENGEGGTFSREIGPRDPTLLYTVVAGQRAAVSGDIERAPDYDRCAQLFYGLIKDRPFYGYNQGTALLTALYYLAKIQRAPTASEKELEVITRIIASNTIRDRTAFKPYTKFEDGEIRFLARYLQENTQSLDKKSYLITYKELASLLQQFGFCLGNPHAGSIDILRIETRPSIFGFRKTAYKRTKVGVIAFSGWTREVSRKDIRLLREYTGLTPRNGFDASLFCKAVPPLSFLINKYRDTFRRIAES